MNAGLWPAGAGRAWWHLAFVFGWGAVNERRFVVGRGRPGLVATGVRFRLGGGKWTPVGGRPGPAGAWWHLAFVFRWGAV